MNADGRSAFSISISPTQYLPASLHSTLSADYVSACLSACLLLSLAPPCCHFTHLNHTGHVLLHQSVHRCAAATSPAAAEVHRITATVLPLTSSFTFQHTFYHTLSTWSKTTPTQAQSVVTAHLSARSSTRTAASVGSMSSDRLVLLTVCPMLFGQQQNFEYDEVKAMIEQVSTAQHNTTGCNLHLVLSPSLSYPSAHPRSHPSCVAAVCESLPLPVAGARAGQAGVHGQASARLDVRHRGVRTEVAPSGQQTVQIRCDVHHHAEEWRRAAHGQHVLLGYEE